MIRLETEYERALGVRPSVSAVILDGRSRLLLELRSDGGRRGLPGGSVEVGESVTEATIREVQEETGLRPAIRRLIGIEGAAPDLHYSRMPRGKPDAPGPSPPPAQVVHE